MAGIYIQRTGSVQLCQQDCLGSNCETGMGVLHVMGEQRGALFLASCPTALYAVGLKYGRFA